MGNSFLRRIFVSESVTGVLEVLCQHKVKTQKRPVMGYSMDGDHRLYSSTELKLGGHHLREGVPDGSMAYIELDTTSRNFEEIKTIIEENFHIVPPATQHAAA